LIIIWDLGFGTWDFPIGIFFVCSVVKTSTACSTKASL
jgi:hypothetical protein